MKIFNLIVLFLLILTATGASNAEVSPCDWGKCNSECESAHERRRPIRDYSLSIADPALRNCKKACHAADDKCEADFKSSQITNQLKQQRELSEAQSKRDTQQREAQARSDAQQREAQADRSAGNRAPDIALICKPVAVKNYQRSDNSSNNSSRNSNDNSNYSYNNSSSSSGSNSGSSSGSSNSYSCGGQGWENIRINFSIWVNEKRCNGVPCSITPNEISFNGNYINRITGMASDQCHTYSCERVSSIAPKF